MSSPISLRAAAILLVLTPALGACGGSFPSYQGYGLATTVAPSRSAESADVAALAGRFYADSLDPAALATVEAELTEALRRDPSSATLHEMAAHVAELRGDDAAAWEHWLRAAADESSPFGALYLDRALGHDLLASQESATIALLEAIRAGHPRADLRVDAGRRLVRLYESRELFEDAARVGDALPYIRAWSLIGAFDNDQGRGFYAEHPPERDPDLSAEHRGVLLPVRWVPASAIDRAGLVSVGDQVSPDRWAVAYLVTHVHTDAAREVELRLTTATGTRVWLNGGLVVDQERLSRAATDNIVVPVHLAAGWNRVLVKSAHGEGAGWSFGARITDPSGAPATGLRFDRAAHETPTVEVAEAPENESPLLDAIAAIEPRLRRELLTHHDAVRSGFEGDALASARVLLERAAGHPVVLYHAALTHWSNDELGRAMDLLNEGVERFADRAGFLWQRGAFYRERDRYDRAIEDLEAARALAPNARLATMELAGTFADRGWREHESSVLEAALERWPDSGWAARALGYSLQERGYLDRAHALFRRADALEPGQAWNLARLAHVARWREDHDAALSFAARLRRLAPFGGEALVTEGDFLRYAGRRDEARARYRAAAEQDPAWTRPHHRLGTMAYEEGDRAGALEAWAAALARNPDDGALADRVDFLRDPDDDPDRQLMPTDAQIEAALARAAEMEIDPGAHTVLVLDDEVTTVQQDGSSMRRVTAVSVAATTDGRDALIENHVPANARVLQAYSVGADGRRQEASSIRGGTIRFRGLEVGSRVVLQYAYHDQPPAFLPNHFVSTWLFQGQHRQLGEARWVVQVPAGRALAMHVQGPVEHTVTRQREHDSHVFTASGVPPLVPEPQMPPARDLLATVVLSTLTDWHEYVEWERALLSEVFESNPQLRQLAARLTEGAETPQARLDRIYRYVSQEIRYQQDYEDTIAGVRPHSCPVVLERGYGDCKDKAVLMILLGREVGLDIRFAILRTLNAGRVLREVPNQQFNHAIVYVPAQPGIEGGFFMDPTTDGLDMGNLRADDQGATALVLEPDTGRYEFLDIPYQEPSLSYFRCDVDVEVTSSEDARARAECRVRGQVASMFRRVMRNEERAQQLRQNVAHSIFAGSAVTGGSTEHVEDIDHPLELNLDIDASPTLQPQGDERRLSVPSPFALGRLTRLETRRTPLRMGPPDSARWEIGFSVPRGARIVRTPEDFEVEHPCFRVSRRTTTSGREASVAIDYTRTCAEVSPEDYPELRRLAQRAQNQLQADIVFGF